MTESFAKRPVMLLVAALRAEVRPLMRRLVSTTRQQAPYCELVRGRLGEVELAVLITGDGVQAADRGLEWVVQQINVCRILSVGVAGGLTAGLPPGKIVVAKEVLAMDGERLALDSDWCDRARRAGAVPATVVAGSDMLCTAAQKSSMAQELGLTGPASVDLESGVVARFAHRQGVPALILRAISDALEEDLPLDFNRFVGSHGSVQQQQVVLHALPRPWLWGGLWRLRRTVDTCAEGLCRILVEGAVL